MSVSPAAAAVPRGRRRRGRCAGLSVSSYTGDLLVGVAVDEALVPDSEELLIALGKEASECRGLR
jgi:hypothetical protein